MIGNIIRKTPNGNFMILNYASINKDGYTMKVPVVDSLSEANRFTEKMVRFGRFCIITKSYYDKM